MTRFVEITVVATNRTPTFIENDFSCMVLTAAVYSILRVLPMGVAGRCAGALDAEHGGSTHI